MRCDETRKRLTSSGPDPTPAEVKDHVDGCAACRSYADRLGTARRLLREHHGNVEPDGAFAARVAVRLQDEAAEMLGWAALRLIPATLVIVLFLAWLAFQPASRTETAETAAPTEDTVSWVMEIAQEQR